MITETNNSPLVSIGMPVYNAAKHLEQAIISLLGQRYTNIELIICDNRSSDSTWNLCCKYASIDKRILLSKNETNIGMIMNFYKVLCKAKGDFFMWAAHDDWWEPDFLTTCLKELIKFPEASCCYPLFSRLSSNGRVAVDNPSIAFDDRFSVKRFYKAICKQGSARAFYGLYRTSVIIRAFKPLPYHGLDRAVLDLVAYYGKIVHVAKKLQTYRWKKLTDDEYVSKLDAIGWITRFPNYRKTSELLGAIHLIWIQDITCYQKFILTCVGLIGYYKRYGPLIKLEWKRCAKNKIKNSFSGL
jgi:glycosyltransferase involved in cell wall biosynthesis